MMPGVTWSEVADIEPTLGEMLPVGFFARDTREVARELLGCLLLSRAEGRLCGGRIVETEAYLGADDPGSHAATRGMTARNRVMYGPPGHAYVYFTYGSHHMLNLVTEPDGIAGAVLIRGLEPTVGIDVMRARRPGRVDRDLANGPGKLAAALGLDMSDNAGRLGQGRIAVFPGGTGVGEAMACSGRIGLSAGHDLELRWYLQGNEYVSRGRPGEISRATRGTDGRTRE